MWWWTLILAAVVAWTVRTLLNVPVPPGYKAPWTLRMTATFIRILFFPAIIIGKLWSPIQAMLYLRKLFDLMYVKSTHQDGSSSIKIKDAQVDGVTVRIYEPEHKNGNSPAVIFYHGGGWVVASIAMYEPVCLAMVEHLKTVVISVGYRLAPEHVFPAAIDDCFVATRHFLTKGEDYGIDPNRVAIVGDSAGGNLVAAAALRLRDEKISPQPKLQVLIYPATQAIDFKSPSYMANENDPFLSKQFMVTYWVIYAFGHADYLNAILANEHTSPEVKRKFSTTDLDHKFILNDHPDNTYRQPNLNVGDGKVWKEIESIFTNPYFAPLMAKDLSRLPEAIVITMHQDVLRDDGIWYARKLKDAGNDVTLIDYRSGFHGLISVVKERENYLEVVTMMYDLLKDRLK